MITQKMKSLNSFDIDRLAAEIKNNISLESGEEIIDIIPQDYGHRMLKVALPNLGSV